MNDMFENVMESFRRATEATVHLQQEMFNKWISLWSGLPGPPVWQQQAKEVQKKWAETMHSLIKRRSEATEAQFKAGLANIQKAFQIAEAKSPEEWRAASLELWRQCFDELRKVHEAQVQAFEAGLQKWGGN
jgi:hypothetical protein